MSFTVFPFKTGTNFQVPMESGRVESIFSSMQGVAGSPQFGFSSGKLFGLYRQTPFVKTSDRIASPNSKSVRYMFSAGHWSRDRPLAAAQAPQKVIVVQCSAIQSTIS